MEEKQAFFVNGEYYLLPKQYESFEKLMEVVEAKNSVKLKLKKLNETKCMSPYFTYEAITEETISLSGSELIFKTKVYLLSAKEYHDKLVAIIKQKCMDCANFIDDGDYEQLNGHHEEVSLDSVCFKKRLKDDEIYYVFAYELENTVKLFNLKKSGIENLINEGKTNEAKDEFYSVLLKFMPAPLEIVLLKKKKTFECFFPTFSADGWALIYYFFSKYLNGKVDGWKFYSYLPQGTLPLKPEFAPTVFEEVIEAPNFSRKILNFFLKEDNLINFSETYMYLCSDMGEDNFLRGVADYFVSYGSEKNGKEVPYAEFKKALMKTKKTESLFADKSPVPVWHSVASYDQNGLPNKLASYCANLFFNCYEKVENAFDPRFEYSHLLEDLGIAVAKLSITVKSAIFSKNVISGLTHALEKMLENDFAVNFAREILNDKYNLFFLVFNKEKFLYELKRHSPIFEKYSATLDIADQIYSKKYEVSHLFKLISSEKLNLTKKD